MSDSTTTARPYAKAVFEHALTEKKLADWSKYLHALAQAVMCPEAAQFIANPASTVEQHEEILVTVCSTKAKADKSLKSLIAVLAHNGRLMVLPEISFLFDELKSEHEKTLEVDVISFSKVSAEQQKQLIESLSNRLQRKVALNISIDTTLIGGAVIRAGDLVIDGSVRGKLSKLGTEVAA